MNSPEPVSFTVHTVGTPDLNAPELAAQRRTRSGRLKMLLVLLVCAAPVVASYFTYFVIRPQGRTNYSTLILPTRSLPDMPMTDLSGKTVTAQQLHGQWLLVTVGPAACGPECEKRLLMQRQLREMLGRESDRLDKVWFVTDGAALAPKLEAAVLSGVPVQLIRAPASAVAQWLQPQAGHKLEDHLYLVDPMGEWMMRMPVDPEPARVKRDLDRVLRAASFWDQPGR